MVSVDLVGDSSEGQVPFSVAFTLGNSLAGQSEVEIRVDSVLTDTIIVEPASIVAYSHTFVDPGQHVIQFLETAGGGGNPTEVGFVFWATEDPAPPEDVEPEGSFVISARMILFRNVGGGMSQRIPVELPVDDVIGAQAAAAALLPLYEAQSCTFDSMEITERAVSTEDPRNP